LMASSIFFLIASFIGLLSPSYYLFGVDNPYLRRY
jgi:hypothetical protein